MDSRNESRTGQDRGMLDPAFIQSHQNYSQSAGQQREGRPTLDGDPQFLEDPGKRGERGMARSSSFVAIDLYG